MTRDDQEIIRSIFREELALLFGTVKDARPQPVQTDFMRRRLAALQDRQEKLARRSG